MSVIIITISLLRYHYYNIIDIKEFNILVHYILTIYINMKHRLTNNFYH